jgi:periplasmic divalent cation tolerance protein
MNYIIVRTTFDSLREAEQTALLLVENKLAACCQLQEIKSVYRWKGELFNEKEFLLSAKTRAEKYIEIEEFIRARHSYDVPEIVAVPLTDGLIEYLNWIDESLT